MESQDNNELLGHLTDAAFHIPARSFMDENCLIFDPSIETTSGHFAVFISYQKLVKGLLHDFCSQRNIKFDNVYTAVKHMHSEADLREVFNERFEEVLSAFDFEVFCQAMVKQNIIIQEHVLRMILTSTGVIPDSLLASASKSDEEKPAVVSEKHPCSPVLQKEDSKKKRTDPNPDLKESLSYEHQKKQIEKDMKQLVLDFASSSRETKQTTSLTASRQTPTTLTNIPSSGMVTPSSELTSADAAQNWMMEAQRESANYLDGKCQDFRLKTDAADLKKRQQFLREQRDKIIEMRRQAREKQSGSVAAAENQQKPKPASPPSVNEKMLAKRRALAAKLRQEVVDKE